ncbi:MAG: glycosyltransferase [Anaerotardibacter sp.]
MQELLSIIIPVYNAEKYLQSCVDSLIASTYKNIEIILIDDGSRDSSGTICDSFAKKDSRVRVIHKSNGGCASARNEGIEASKGTIITFVDADDIVDPDIYEILISNLNQTNSCISACGILFEHDLDNIQTVKHDCTPETLVYATQSEIFESATREKDSIEGYVWNKVYRREVVGKHRFRSDVAIIDDAIWSWETLKDAKRVCYCSLPLYHYVMIPTSIVHSSNIEKRLTALKGKNEIVQDAKKISKACYEGQCIQYIQHCESCLIELLSSANPDKRIYKYIKKEALKHRTLFSKLPIKGRLLVSVLCSNYSIGIITMKLLNTFMKN